MINTRLLERGLRGRRPGASGTAAAGSDAPGPEAGAVAPDAGPGSAPRALRHDPVLQGRVGAPPRDMPPGAAGLTSARNPLVEARLEDLWAGLPQLADTIEAAVAANRQLPPLDRASAFGRALDQLRSQVLRVIGARGWRRIGIAGTRRGAGASFITLGLTASFARLDYLRLAVVDLDLSHPSLARHLMVEPAGALDMILSESRPVIEQVQRIGEGVALILNDTPVPEAAELIYSPEAVRAMQALGETLQPDLMLIDLPPLLGEAAIQAALAQVDAVLLVADGTETTPRDIAECERLLEGQTPLLGIVLNKAEDASAAPGQD